MNGNLWYELARELTADRQRAARQAGEARQARATARARRARDRDRDRAQETAAALAIPDYAHEMFAELPDAVPASRRDAGRGRGTRTSR
jgi:hypothetical protein